MGQAGTHSSLPSLTEKISHWWILRDVQSLSSIVNPLSLAHLHLPLTTSIPIGSFKLIIIQEIWVTLGFSIKNQCVKENDMEEGFGSIGRETRKDRWYRAI